MVKKLNPRHGSMQYWPRVRAKKVLPRIRSWTDKGAQPLGFVGYKVGMAHIMGTETKGKLTIDHATPATIIECPPFKIFSVRFYKNNQVVTEIISPNVDKNLAKKVRLPKKNKKKLEDVTDYDSIRIIAHTQPSQTGTGKKTPELTEMALGGKKEEQLTWVKEHLDKEVSITDLFSEKEQVDVHGVTKGKGYQGVVKRFGVNLKSHKSEKGQRRVGARSGGWSAQAHMMYRVAQPGKMGYHTRTEYNKVILKIEDALENPKAGFKNYGLVKNPCLVIKGSIPGARKRALTITPARRPNRKYKKSPITYEKVIL